MPLEGLQLGKYRLVRLIGSGGMGDVYLGEDARLNRQLAIKVMRAEVSPYPDADAVKEAARLFQREMKAIARLDHPLILPLYDYGEELLHQTTLIYMVMPFRLEGSLADWLRQRNSREPLRPQDIASLLSQATEALQYVHDQQIIHQDVKLSNFLIRGKKDVSSPPDLQLADFGIAKIGSATTSMSHASRGTPISMAPEQWNGDPVPATDQYALAIMTYELLTGRPPFRGRPEQMMYQHLTAAPPPPGTFRKDLPASIDAVLLRALAKNPQERFPSISAFAVAFQQALQSTGDLYATLAISEEEAATGTKRELTLPGGRKAQVSIPLRVQDKQMLRLEGLGEPCYAGGPPGALILTLAIYSQDKTVLAKEAVHDETVASIGTPYRAGTTETIGEPSPPPLEASAMSADPQFAQKLNPGIPTGERQVTPRRPDEKVNVWKIGKRQVMAMIVGSALFAILSPFSIFAPFGVLLPAIVFLLFFGEVFGPWVGLVVGGVGTFISYYVVIKHFHIFRPVGNLILDFEYYYYKLYGYLGILFSALTGFIAGLALLITRRHYNRILAIAISDAIGAAGVLVDLSRFSLVFLSQAFTRILLPNALFSLLLLPILLLIYDKIAERRKLASTTP